MTVTIQVVEQGGDSVILDEVAVGEWHTPRITSTSVPDSMSGTVTVKGENFEPGAVVRIDETPFATAFVDSATLITELAEGVKPGVRALWVKNPGGEEALTTIHVGLPNYLPLIGRSK